MPNSQQTRQSDQGWSLQTLTQSHNQFLVPILLYVRLSSSQWGCLQIFDPYYHKGYFSRLETLTSLVMSPKVNLMDPFLQLIIALAVAWNGCLRITEFWALRLDIGCLKNYEINGVDKLPNPDKDIINFPLRTFTERSASWIVTRVRLRSPNPSRWQIDKGSKLILAPKSRSARLISAYPIVQAMVGQLGSLYLTGIGPDNSSLILVAKKTFLRILVFLFLVHMSLRNFA